MTDWSFRRRQGWCQACEKHFEEGERHASSLAVVGEALAREDLCSGCWLGRAGRDELFHWFTRHREGKRGLQLDLGTLEALFVRLEGRVEPRVREMRYLLALLLLRKRRIKVDRILREGDGESMLVHQPRRKESLRVFVFDFTPERMQELRADLVLLLEGAEPTHPGDGGDDSGDDSSPLGARETRASGGGVSESDADESGDSEGLEKGLEPGSEASNEASPARLVAG